MKETYENGILTMELSGRLTAENSGAVLEEIREVTGRHPDAEEYYFDCEKLDYLSSSGLRLLMKVRNETGVKPHLINVSDAVMDVLETTGFTELLYASGPLKQISLEGAEEIGHGRFGAVYRLDEERVIKVCFDESTSTLAKIERDRDISRELFKRGVPTAIPYELVITPRGYGVIYEMIKGQTLRQYIYTHPEKLETVFPDVARLVRKLHQTDVSDLHLPSSNEILEKQIGMILPLLPDDKKEYVTEFFRSIPSRKTLVHGDLNLGNVMIIDREDGSAPEALFIDIADAMCGHPVFDFVTVYLSASLADRAFLGTPVEEMSMQVAMKKEMASKELFGEDLGGRSGTLMERVSDYWRIMLTVYFDPSNEEEYNGTDEALCELGRSALIRPYDRNASDGAAMDLLFRTYLDHLPLLGKVFDLNW